MGGKDASKKKIWRDKNVDLEKLADSLQKLSEEDLLQVVTMVYDKKSSDTYTKNDVENGEFHVNLYILSSHASIALCSRQHGSRAAGRPVQKQSWGLSSRQ